MQNSEKSLNFTPDFSRKAVFSPASRHPFTFLPEIAKMRVTPSNQHLIAWWAINLSHLTYFPTEKIIEKLPPNCQLITLKQKQSQLFFCTKIDDLYFLSFQGSCSPEDFWIDINFFPKKYNEAFYHRGFLKAFSLLWNDLEYFSHEIDLKNLIICGHSLGGALAHLLSTKIAHRAVFTFGAPRVTFMQNEPAKSQNIYRYLNNSDVITALPPALFGFRHLGNLYFIDGNQTIHQNPSFKTLLSQLAFSSEYIYKGEWLKKGNNFIRSIADHAPINYSTALSRHLLKNSLEN